MCAKRKTRSDAQLLEAWREGDSEAGAQLFERHWASVTRFFTNKIGVDCQDQVQDTFLACVEARDRFAGRSSFRAFLFGIARNKLLRYLRDKSRDRGRFHSAKSSIAGTLRSFTSAIAQDRERERLHAALRELPVDTQVMLELHYWEQMKIHEIAEVVELPENTVKTIMRRGRLKLAKQLGTADGKRAA